MEDIISITKRNFSFAWSHFGKKEVEKSWYKDSFSYLKYISSEIFKGEDKIGLDVGCGSGGDMIYISQYGARIIGIDISDAIAVTAKNIKNFNSLYVAQADIYNLPFKNESFDFAYSFGVLHHLPMPEKGFKTMCSKIKKSGFAIVYLYEDFSQRSILERGLLKIVNSFRFFTKRLPPYLIYFFSLILSPFILLICSIPYKILKKLRTSERITERIPYRHTTNLEIIIADLYDRFSTPIENRYNREQVEAWFRNANFEDVKIINYRGWVAWGRKK